MNYSGFNLKLHNQSGQALLIVVLVMVVALTVTLSLVSRSIINIKTSTDQANSQKALSAAEAGIERTLKSGTSIASGSFENNTEYSTTITQVSGSSGFLVNGGNIVLKHEGATVWLAPYANPINFGSVWSGNITINWEDSQDSCDNDGINDAAIEVVLIRGTNINNLITERKAFDPCDTRRGQNQFSPPTAAGNTIDGTTFAHSAVINGIANGILIKVIPLYSNSKIGISSSVPLPNQGTLITSTGTLETTERKVTLFQGYPELPAELFPYSLLSL